jgi:hypothetical protein
MRPVHKIPEQLPDEVLGRAVRETTLRIKTLGGIADHHFGLVERMHVQSDKDLPQVILGARRAQRPHGCAHHGDGLTVPGIVPVWTRRPVDRILEHARN